MDHPWSITGSCFTKYWQLLPCFISIFIEHRPPSTHKISIIKKRPNLLRVYGFTRSDRDVSLLLHNWCPVSYSPCVGFTFVWTRCLLLILVLIPNLAPNIIVWKAIVQRGCFLQYLHFSWNMYILPDFLGAYFFQNSYMDWFFLTISSIRFKI